MPIHAVNQALHVIIHTLSKSFCPCLYSSPPPPPHFTDGHPIISTLMFQMPKPSQSATPHHLSHTQLFNDFSISKIFKIFNYLSLDYLYPQRAPLQEGDHSVLDLSAVERFHFPRVEPGKPEPSFRSP